MTVPEGLQWGYKFVGTDLCTDDHQGGRYRYHLGQWHEVGGEVHPDPCPRAPGDGLCVARTLSGAQSGGARLGASVMLLVGYRPEDVLAESLGKLRVSRLWVAPDPLDPMQVLIGRGADLTGADISGANLTRANLTRVDLTRADLTGANLTRVDLTRANLTRANLAGANLYGAYLTGASLSGAYLAGATLTRAYLAGANLYEANLSGAYLVDANLRGANLGDAYLGGACLRGANLRDADGIRSEYLPEGWMLNADGCVVGEDES